jgi:hypothetical protein
MWIGTRYIEFTYDARVNTLNEMMAFYIFQVLHFSLLAKTKQLSFLPKFVSLSRAG